MSQRRQKKQLTVADNVNSLTDQELRAALKTYDVSAGPITDSTRNLYRGKLASLIEAEDDVSADSADKSTKQSKRGQSTSNEDDDDNDTSDEDFEVEELEEEDDDEEEELYDEEEEDLMSELQEDDLSRANNSAIGLADLSTRTIGGQNDANSISRGILVMLVTFFVVIFSYYLVSSKHLNVLEPLRPFKSVIVFALMMLPTLYIARKTFRYYRLQRYEENKRVCNLVSEAIELLQSPDNPRGLMPILHIRDTLLTPAERKTRKVTALWAKTVKFIEDHESRVKVELVNIDGEDFRAWKWIGTKKL